MTAINKQKPILIILIVLSIIIGIFLRLCIFNKTILIISKIKRINKIETNIYPPL